MPEAPLKRCSYPHCIELTSGGRCDKHKAKAWEHKRGTKRVIDMVYESLLCKPDELITLCDCCHDKAHEAIKEGA